MYALDLRTVTSNHLPGDTTIGVAKPIEVGHNISLCEMGTEELGNTQFTFCEIQKPFYIIHIASCTDQIQFVDSRSHP